MSHFNMDVLTQSWCSFQFFTVTSPSPFVMVSEESPWIFVDDSTATILAVSDIIAGHWHSSPLLSLQHARLHFPTLLKLDITIWLAFTNEMWAEVVCVISSWEHLTTRLVSPAFFHCHIIVKARADNRASTSLVSGVTTMSRAFLLTCSKHEQEMSLSFQTSKILGLFITAA